MCFLDSASLVSLTAGISRRGFLSTGVAAGVAAAATDWGRSVLLPGVAEGAETPGRSGGPGGAGGNFKEFGTDGWDVGFRGKSIICDPRVSRVCSVFLA